MYYFLGFTILYSLPLGFHIYDIYIGNNKDFKKYPIRHLFIPVSCIITIFYVLNKHSNLINIIKNPLVLLNYADIWGSLWCFIAAFFGIIGILEI